MTQTPIPRRWRWRGRDAHGRPAQGEISAPSAAVASHLLRRRDLSPEHIVAVRYRPARLQLRASDTTGLVRRLATLLVAGVPLPAALDILIRSGHSRGITRMARSIAEDIDTGESFSQAIERASPHLQGVERQLLAAGELSGQLAATLGRLAAQREHLRQLRERIQRALSYPVTVLVVAICVIAALLKWVVPEFERLFSGAAGQGVVLPPITHAVIELSRMAMAHGLSAIVGMAAATLGINVALRRSARLRTWRDRTMLRVPGIGPILRDTSGARWARTLGTLVDAGVPLPDAMDAAVGACGNRQLQRRAREVHHAVTRGARLGVALAAHREWPPVLAQMAAVGEESGTLGRMLNQAADLLDDAAAHALVTVCATLEPMMITLLGLMIGAMVLAMYLPMFQLGYGAA